MEITKEGVSGIRPYSAIEDEFIVWNSNVIERDYVLASRELLERQLVELNANSIHPDTGERIDDEKERKQVFQKLRSKLNDFADGPCDTHFQDFVENLSRKDDETLDETTLKTSNWLLVTCVIVIISHLRVRQLSL